MEYYSATKKNITDAHSSKILCCYPDTRIHIDNSINKKFKNRWNQSMVIKIRTEIDYGCVLPADLVRSLLFTGVGTLTCWACCPPCGFVCAVFPGQIDIFTKGNHSISYVSWLLRQVKYGEPGSSPYIILPIIKTYVHGFYNKVLEFSSWVVSCLQSKHVYFLDTNLELCLCYFFSDKHFLDHWRSWNFDTVLRYGSWQPWPASGKEKSLS